MTGCAATRQDVRFAARHRLLYSKRERANCRGELGGRGIPTGGQCRGRDREKMILQRCDSSNQSSERGLGQGLGSTWYWLNIGSPVHLHSGLESDLHLHAGAKPGLFLHAESYTQGLIQIYSYTRHILHSRQRKLLVSRKLVLFEFETWRKIFKQV